MELDNYIIATILGVVSGVVAIPIAKYIYKKLNWPWTNNEKDKE